MAIINLKIVTKKQQITQQNEMVQKPANKVRWNQLNDI